MSLRSTARALIEAHVNFIVVGGVAATIHGSARVTNDLDICYETDPANIARLVEVLHVLRAELRGAEPGLPFIIDARTFRDTPLLTLTTTEGALDLMDIIPGVGNYHKALTVSERIDWDDLTIYALSLNALIDAKRAAGRTKDREHLLELEVIRELNTQ